MKKLKIIAVILLITVNPLAGQNGNTIINKSYKLDSIIKLKKELNSKIQNLRIQIYNGDRTNAELIIKEYIDNFNDTTADIIYETPNYKIWVGNYYTQLEADKNLIKIRKKFSSAFIFRPELIEEMDENQDID
ncbi:MAG: SPOR domain-containing protein [Flavobacteriaceae bacterium]|tara:strand:- start:3 stop:401 length:399 start_codon:yes stop_codon:yes gene_type:complete